jgi:hydroxyacylglutathione hydrolase
MSVIFKRIHTEGIAQLSYFLGDSVGGVAFVVDPRPDCAVYLEHARRHGVAIAGIIETHIHADFMSGSRELSRRLGSAPIYASHAGGASYGFHTQKVEDGRVFELGSLRLTVRHTPGHTPEHISLLLSERKHKEPFGVLSGDTLLVNSVGRPDLVNGDRSSSLALALSRSVRGFYGGMDDGVMVYPGHGAGSACGADIGDRESSTLGYEKRHNPYFQIGDEKDFVAQVLSKAPPEPRYYRQMKMLNAAGPPTYGGLPPAPPLASRAFRIAMESGGHVLLDTRDLLSFGGGHIQGSLNIPARAELSIWAGQLLGFDDSILLVLEDDDELDRVVRLLWRTGYTNFAGYLAGGMGAWETAGHPFDDLPQMSIHELRANGAQAQVLDVRSPAEWAGGHIPGAQHIYLPDLRAKSGQLDRGRPVVTYCDSGYRASIAASLLKQLGFERVYNLPGSLRAWKRAGYPVEKEEG